MKILIFISWPVKAWCIPDAQVAALRATFPDVDFLYAGTREEAADLVRDADVAFTPFLTADMVASAPRLKWVHSAASAVEGLLPLAALAERRILVTNSRGVQAVAMAEHVMGGLLMLSHKFNRMFEAQRERRWIQNDLVNDWPWLLQGKSMTIVGLGTIGMEVAKRAHAFEMRVSGVRRRTSEPKPNFVDQVVGPDLLESVLHGCDVLVLSTPGVSATSRMITAERIEMLNPGAVIANVARGQVIDEQALIAALQSGRLGGAVLDVFEKEPLDPSSRLWALPNAVISPHSSGLRASHWDEVISLFVNNVRRFRAGEQLDNLVDPFAGY